jgi:hypothetical protein
MKTKAGLGRAGNPLWTDCVTESGISSTQTSEKSPSISLTKARALAFDYQ